MQPKRSHPWNLSESAATTLQLEWATDVLIQPMAQPVSFIAGIDVAYAKQDDKLVAGIVVLDANTLAVEETVVERAEVSFPYIPGLFSFRELPPVIMALAQLEHSPDLLVCDGHGIAHPRRFGLASHLGLLFDVPSIGCAKTPLLPVTDKPDSSRGASTPIDLNGETVGQCLRTQTDVNPVYVSPGHRISIEESVEWILRLCPKYRLPETTRHADHAVNMAL